MGSDGYQVVLSELQQAAADHKTHSASVQQMLKEWEKAAKLDPKVFGNLAASPTIASQYQTFYDEVSKAVTQLYQALENGSNTLLRTAAGYYAAEQATKLHLQYVSEVGVNNKYLNQAASGKGK